LQFLGAFFLNFLEFVAVLVIFHHLSFLAGWSLAEVAFLYGSSSFMFKLADMLMTNMDRLPTIIRMGTFDQVLTRPLGTLGQVMTGDIDLRQVGAMLQGVLVFLYALDRLHISWSPQRVIVLVLMLVSAAAIFSGIYVITNSIAFWTTDAREVANSFTYGGQAFTEYPLHIFGVWFRRFLGYVIPLAFVNYLPALYILGKADPTHAPVFLRFMSPVVAVLVCAIAGWVWRFSVRHYRSTGS
jgi:ABC-2 type transport system permease protein